MKFYSDMTKKLYESEEELKTAEKEVADAEAKKAEAEEGSSYVEDDEEDASDEDSVPSVTEAPKAAEKPNKKECSGQIDLFSLFG